MNPTIEKETTELPEMKEMRGAALLRHIAITEQAKGYGGNGVMHAPWCLLGAYGYQRGLFDETPGTVDTDNGREYVRRMGALAEDIGIHRDDLANLYRPHDRYRAGRIAPNNYPGRMTHEDYVTEVSANIERLGIE